MTYITFPVIGFLIELLIISLGGGSGGIYVGILTAFFNVSPAIAASTSLATIIPTTAIGTFSHWKAGNINLRFGLTMSVGGAISGLMGISGSTPIVAGLLILGCSALETVGTSIMVLVGISVTGFLMHLGLGSVDWKLVGLLAAGTMTGAFIAPILLKRTNKQKMEKIIQPILLIMTVSLRIILIFK